MNGEPQDIRQSKLITILRWIIVFPASLIVAVAIGLIVGVFYSLFQEEGFWRSLFGHTIAGGLTGYMVVWLGAKIAPSHKKIVAYILGVFAIAYSGMALYGVLLQRDYWGLWQMFVLIVAVGFTLYEISKDNNDII